MDDFINNFIRFFQDLLFKGKVPGLKYIKIGLSLVPIIALSVILNPNIERDFAKFGWDVLIVTLCIRPLMTIFPRLVILSRMMLIRKQLGIIAGTFVLAHGVGVFLRNQLGVSDLFSAELWNLKIFLGWGLWGAVMILPPLLTSNNFLQVKLGKLWKPLQKISYLFFIFGGIHYYLFRQDLSILVELFLWAIIWALAWKKIILWETEKNPSNLPPPTPPLP